MNIFTGLRVQKHLVLHILKSFFSLMLWVAPDLCVDLSSVGLGLSDCLAADLANRKHMSSSTTEVALVLEDPNRLYYLLCEVLTAAKMRNTPADAHDTNRRRSSHVLECRIEGREPDHYPNQPSVCGSYLPFILDAKHNRSATRFPRPFFSFLLHSDLWG